jgi:hypothetical protein
MSGISKTVVKKKVIADLAVIVLLLGGGHVAAQVFP